MPTTDEQDVLRDILGLDVAPDRQAEVIAAFGDILREIKKLRALDLSDVHPAVVFNPVVVTEASLPVSREGETDAS